MATLLTVFLTGYMLRMLSSILTFCKDFRRNTVIAVFRLALWTPCGRRYLGNEQAKVKADFESRIRAKRKGVVHKLPEEPWREETILNRIK
jgi:hypothetical protein